MLSLVRWMSWRARASSQFALREARVTSGQEVEGVKDTGVLLRIVESLSAGFKGLGGNGFYIRSGR